MLIIVCKAGRMITTALNGLIKFGGERIRRFLHYSGKRQFRAAAREGGREDLAGATRGEIRNRALRSARDGAIEIFDCPAIRREG